MEKDNGAFKVNGQIWIQKANKNFIGHGRVELLENIMLHGSISKAAKAMKMSYKAAWDSVDAMNNLSVKPLVKRVSGGRGGGGTVVTAYAKEVIDTYKELSTIHNNFLQTLGISFDERLGSQSHTNTVFSRLYGKILNITYKEENVEVEINLDCNQTVTAVTSKLFIEHHQIKISNKIEMLIESDDIILMNEEVASSARNYLKGKVAKIEEAYDNVIVTLDIGSNLLLKAHITTTSLKNLSLRIGTKATAVFKAFNVTLFPIKIKMSDNYQKERK